MSSAPPPRLSPRVRREQARFRRLGLGLLLGGGLAAAAVFAFAPVPAEDYYMPETKKGDYQMEVIAGKTNLLGTELTQWFVAQWHGRPLARTLLVLTLAAAGGCFFIAHRLKYGPPEPGEPA